MKNELRKSIEIMTQSIFDYAETLGAAIQKYADMLERELNIG